MKNWKGTDKHTGVKGLMGKKRVKMMTNMMAGQDDVKELELNKMATDKHTFRAS